MVSGNGSGNGMAPSPLLRWSQEWCVEWYTSRRASRCRTASPRASTVDCETNASMRRCSRGGPCPLRARRLAARLQSRQAARKTARAHVTSKWHTLRFGLGVRGAANAYIIDGEGGLFIAESVPRTSLPRSGIRDLYLICSSGERRSRTAVRIIIAIDSITNPVLHTICETIVDACHGLNPLELTAHLALPDAPERRIRNKARRVLRLCCPRRRSYRWQTIVAPLLTHGRRCHTQSSHCAQTCPAATG